MHLKLIFYAILALSIPAAARAQIHAELAGTLTLPDQRWIEGNDPPTLTVSLRSLGMVMEDVSNNPWNNVPWNVLLGNDPTNFQYMMWPTVPSPQINYFTILGGGVPSRPQTIDLRLPGYDPSGNAGSSYGLTLIPSVRGNDIMFEMRYWGVWSNNDARPVLHPGRDLVNMKIGYKCNAPLHLPDTVCAKDKVYVIRIGALEMVPQTPTCQLSTNALRFDVEAQLEQLADLAPGETAPNSRAEALVMLHSCHPRLSSADVTITGCSPSSGEATCKLGGTAQGLDAGFRWLMNDGREEHLPIGRRVSMPRAKLEGLRGLGLDLVRNQDPLAPGTLDGALWLQIDYP